MAACNNPGNGENRIFFAPQGEIVFIQKPLIGDPANTDPTLAGFHEVRQVSEAEYQKIKNGYLELHDSDQGDG